MISYVRRKKIADLLSKSEIIYISDLKRAMPEISESTIKRELRSMQQEGIIEMLRGGAVKLYELHKVSYDTPMDLKEQQNIDRKERIAKFAASLIHSGDAVFLDASSTVVPILKYVGNKVIKIITSSIMLPLTFQNSTIDFYLVGGQYNPNTKSVLGTMTEQTLSNMFFDKAFLGANGFSEAGGVTTPDFREQVKKQIIMKNSSITYFLMDSFKAGVNTLCKVADLGEVNIITDEKNDLLDMFKSYKIAK